VDEVLVARFQMIVVRRVDIDRDIVCARCQIFPGMILRITMVTKGALHRSILLPTGTAWNMTITARDRERILEDHTVEVHRIIEAQVGAIEAEIETMEGITIAITIEIAIVITEIMDLEAIAEEAIAIRIGEDAIAIDQGGGLEIGLAGRQGAQTDAAAVVRERAGDTKEDRDVIVAVVVPIGVEVAQVNDHHIVTEGAARPGLLIVVWDIESEAQNGVCPPKHPEFQLAVGPTESGTLEREAAAGVGVKVGNGERAAVTRRTGHEDVAAGAEVAVLEWIRVDVN
jgi:hypothetical protein